MAHASGGRHRVLALIPARGGSKGIPRKNLALVAGRPLIAYSVDAARNAGCIDDVVVSTEDAEIARVSRELGAEVIERPVELAGDDTPMLDVMDHAIRSFETLRKCSVSVIVLLQPTSPLRTAEDIERAYSLFVDRGVKCVLSVVATDKKVLKTFVKRDDGTIRGVFDDDAPFRCRQELPDVFQANGAIYIYDAQELIRTKVLLPQASLPYEMASEKSLDIDVPEDIAVAARLLGGPQR